MATTLISVETREVVRCDSCSLVQYRTANSLCRKCHKPLDFEEPDPLAPQLVTTQAPPVSNNAGLQVAAQVREIRRARHLSQRQLAGRMQVPRTYISKIENGKAVRRPIEFLDWPASRLIVGSGLKDGDMIITDPKAVVDGASITSSAE